MKAFVASLIVLAALLTLIGINAVFIHRTADKLEVCIEALSPDDESALAELEGYWQRQRTLIGLSVSTDVIWEIDERIAEIRSAVIQKDEAEFDLSTRLALVAIEHMRRAEQCSVDNLL